MTSPKYSQYEECQINIPYMKNVNICPYMKNARERESIRYWSWEMLNGFLPLVEKNEVWSKSVLVKLVLINLFCRSKIQGFIKVHVSQQVSFSL